MNQKMEVVVHYAIVEYIYSAEIGYCTHHLDEHLFICIPQQKLTEDTSAYYMIVALAYILNSWFSHVLLLVVSDACPLGRYITKKWGVWQYCALFGT
jgi:hypothetical protein